MKLKNLYDLTRAELIREVKARDRLIGVFSEEVLKLEELLKLDEVLHQRKIIKRG